MTAAGKGRRLRIAYLLQQFPLPTQTFAISDVAALLAEGHEVAVFTMKWPRRGESELLKRYGVPEGLRIDRPGWAGVGAWPMLIWRWRASLPIMLRAIAKGVAKNPLTAIQALLCIPRILEIADRTVRSDYDVVHSFWSRHSGLVLPVLKTRRARALRSAFAGAYDLVADDFLVDVTLGAADLAFSHAEVNRAYLEQKADPSNVAIIRRGIPLPELSTGQERDPFLWMTASSLIPPKNVEGVIRAFASARERQPKLKLRIFGEGPDGARLERIAREFGCSEAVSFGGHVAREQLFAEMRRASVFLLFSTGEWERLPNVLKEALWAGCAVISSNSPGIEELIPDESVGQVVDPNDPEALERAVTAVLGYSEEQLAAHRRRARAHVAEYFSSEEAMRRYADAWRKRVRSTSAS